MFILTNQFYFSCTGTGVVAADWWWGLWHNVPAANAGSGENGHVGQQQDGLQQECQWDKYALRAIQTKLLVGKSLV